MPAAQLEAQALAIERMGGRLVSADITRLDDVDEPYQGVILPGLPRTPAIANETGQLRELYRLLGHDPDAPGLEGPAIRALIERGIPPMGGGATGAAATAYMSNLPAEGSFIMNAPAFGRETERNEMPLEQKAVSLGGAPIDLRIPNVGILAGLKLVVKGTLVVTTPTGTCTSGYGWPWNLLGRVSLNLQGQTGLISAPGMDLRARNRRLYRNPREDVSTAPAADATTGNPVPGVIAAGSYAVVLVYDVPIVHDSYTLTGAVYAQSDAVYLNWRIQPATAAELFVLTGTATVAFSGMIHTTMTFYDIPFSDTQQGRKVLLPDLRWLHSVLSADKPFSNTGDVQAEVIRTAGQLVMLGVYLDNGGITQVDAAAWDQLTFGYGGNKQPRVYSPMEVLLDKNCQDYNGRIRPGWAILDFEIDNPERELVMPKGVTELKITPKVAAGTTIAANARVHQVYEILFAGAGG